MKTRAAIPEDFPRLKEIHAQSGLKFPLPDLDSAMIEGIEVVVDDRGEIMFAAIAKRVPEFYMLAPSGTVASCSQDGRN